MNHAFHRIIIIGNRGNFGQFLEKELRRLLSNHTEQVELIGVDIPFSLSENRSLLHKATDIVVSLPLKAYHDYVKVLLMQWIDDEAPLKNSDTVPCLWLLPSVHTPTASILRSQKDNLSRNGVNRVEYILCHPMFGPHSFEASTNGTRGTFQTIVTEVSSTVALKKAQHVSRFFQNGWGIGRFQLCSVDTHDKEIAATQGAVFALARFLRSEELSTSPFRQRLHHAFECRFPQMMKSFQSDKSLIDAFATLNPYFEAVETHLRKALITLETQPLEPRLLIAQRADSDRTLDGVLLAFRETFERFHQHRNIPISTLAFRTLLREAETLNKQAQ